MAGRAVEGLLALETGRSPLPVVVARGDVQGTRAAEGGVGGARGVVLHLLVALVRAGGDDIPFSLVRERSCRAREVVGPD